MTKNWLTRGCLTLGMMGAVGFAVQAGYPEFADVQSRVGDAAPGVAESNINNYLHQDEQINVNPDDGQLRVLRTSQKALVNDYTTKLIPLRNATGRELRNVFRVVTALEGGRAEVVRDKETGDTWLQVIAPDFMIPYLEDAVRALDVGYVAEYNDGAADLYFRLKHREAADVDAIASFYAGSEGFSTIDSTNNALRRFDEVYRNERYAEAAALVDIPCNQVELDVKIYEVNAGNDLKLGLDYINWSNGPGRNLFFFAEGYYSARQRARNVTSIFDPFLDARATVYPEDEKVRVLSAAARESYRAVNYLLTSNYVDFLQSKGEAQLVRSQKLLICSANSGQINAMEPLLGFYNNTNDIYEGSNATPVSFTRSNSGSLVYTSLRDALINSLTGQVIPNPNAPTPTPVFEAAKNTKGYSGYIVLTREMLDGLSTNQLRDLSAAVAAYNPNYIAPAYGGEVGYNNGYAVGIDGSTFNPPSSVTFGLDSDRRLYYDYVGSVGMALSATPYVGLESMELELEIDLGELAGIAPSGLPIINTRTVTSTVRLLDGQPFVVAGVSSKKTVESTAKAPLLGSIPVLGYLFGGEQDIARESDFVITITPRFILSSQVNIDTPPQISTMELIVNGDADQGAPALKIGYDQWLLDS